MTLDSKWVLTTVSVKKPITDAVFDAMQEVFELDIKPEAQANSPVSQQYPSIPASRGEKRIDHGTNRRSIDTEVKRVPNGVTAELFTESGHGGYLEIGTANMPARPYLFPAWNRFRSKIGKLIGVKIRAIKKAGK